MKQWVSVIGNIGVGKTTLINKLKHEYETKGIDCVVFNESVGKESLQRFYKNEISAYENQQNILSSMKALHDEIKDFYHSHTNVVVLQDRTYIEVIPFSQTQYALGMMSALEARKLYSRVYNIWSEFEYKNKEINPYLYVKNMNVRELYERIKSRKRTDDELLLNNNMLLLYLDKLNEFYDLLMQSEFLSGSNIVEYVPCTVHEVSSGECEVSLDKVVESLLALRK